jgi:hypothetical protein
MRRVQFVHALPNLWLYLTGYLIREVVLKRLYSIRSTIIGGLYGDI